MEVVVYINVWIKNFGDCEEKDIEKDKREILDSKFKLGSIT